MSNRTAPRTPQRTRAKASARTGGFRRQTARLEGRRDGKPLILGWGRHLTRAQKNAYQHRAAYVFFAVVLAAVVGVGGFGWVQQNYLIPNATIASINNANITQDAYRKLLAYDAQTQWNQLQSELTQLTQAEAKAAQGNAVASNQENILVPQVQTDEANFQQSSITQTVIQEIVEDQLIQQGAAQFEHQQHVSAATFTPTSTAIDKQLQAFKQAFPTGQTYAGFLSSDHLNNADVRDAIALHLRRQLMQTYLASRYSSPTRQVHLRRIEVGSVAEAQKVLSEVKAPKANWATLAKQVSLDANTKDSGGDMGFVAPGTTDTAIENWAFNPALKVGAISPVIRDTTGTFDVVQLLGIDPSRAVNSTALQDAKSNALSHWLEGQKVLPSNHLSNPVLNMVNATRNMPVQPNLNAQLPSVGQPGSSGVPGVTGTPPPAGG